MKNRANNFLQRSRARKIGRLERTVVSLAVVGGLIFRLFNWETRTFWNVDESLTFWYLKDVVIDRKIALIGLHFFSLLHGAVYRTAIFNWIMAVPMAVFGLRVIVLVFIFAILGIISMFCVAGTARRLEGKLAWMLALIVYAFSWYIRVQEMKLWYAALMILLSSMTTWWLFNKDEGGSLRDSFILGLIVGFGFSLHFVVLWLAFGIVVYWLIADRTQLVGKVTRFVLGLGVMVLPLAIFNLRHDFVMKQGLVNMIAGTAVEDQATVEERWFVASHELPCVMGKVESIGCDSIIPLVFVVASILVAGYSCSLMTRKFLIYVGTQLVIGFVGLLYAGRLAYSSQHYVFYVIPLLVVLFSLTLSRLARSPAWIMTLVLLVAYLNNNLREAAGYQDNNSYAHKRKLARYVYALTTEDRIGIMFWDQETLAYDFIFYETSQELGVPYEKVNLIERWGSDKPDGYVFLNEEPSAEGKLLKFGDGKLILTNEFIKKRSL